MSEKNKTTFSDKEYWDREAESFDRIYGTDGCLSGLLNRLFRSDMAGRFHFTLRHALAVPDVEILEIGCGNGVYSAAFLGGGAEHVTAVDLSERMLEMARSRLADFGGRFQTVEGDFMKIPFERTFGVVTAIGVFDYLSDPLPFLRKMACCSERTVIATFPRKGTFRSFVRKRRLSLKGCPVYFYGKDEIEKMTLQCGMAIRHYEVIGQLHCVAWAK